MVDRVRIDKWLWAARFFKTRSLASEAISRNRIRIGGQRIKASRQVQIGDVIQIEKIPYEFVVTVLALNDQRRPAAEAQALYEETAESQQARRDLGERLRSDRMAHAGLAGEGRPSKKQRRQIIRFQNRNDTSEEDAGGDADGDSIA
ncbi:RNA-binding S4 domain-containing protein [Granulosicoccus sp. 3-233]|uniref:RNA-binding S4 domain-containing protein n=1 Tax=Granulosicoccus sp. 3-233 TaxID=3417969 RepID=UPI003D34AFD4